MKECRRQGLCARPGVEINIQSAAARCLARYADASTNTLRCDLDARRRTAKYPLVSLQLTVSGGTTQQGDVGFTRVEARHARVASRQVQRDPLLGMAGAKALRPTLRERLETRIPPDTNCRVQGMSRTGRELLPLQRRHCAGLNARMTRSPRATATQLVELAQLRTNILPTEREIAALRDECPLAITAQDEAQEFPDGRIDGLPRPDVDDRRDDPGQRILLRDQRLRARQNVGTGCGGCEAHHLDRRIGEADVGN